MGRQHNFIYRLTLSIGLALALSGCHRTGGPSATAAYIDEAFGRLFPETASFLSERPGLMNMEAESRDRMSASSGVKQKGYVALARLSEYSEKLILEWRTGPSAPTTLIASPLAAASLVQALPNPGSPRLVVPFGGFLAARENLWSVEYDYHSAYAALGEKAGKIVAKKNSALAEGNKTYCLVIFQDNILRGKDVIDAFTRSYGPVAGEETLKIELIPDAGSSVDSRGAFEQLYGQHLDPQAPVRPAVVVLGIDDAFAAEEAARNDFGSAGAGEPPEPEFLADCGSWGEGRADRRLFAWRIEADGREIAKKAYALARKLEAEAGAKVGEDTQGSAPGESQVSLVPLRLRARGGIF